MFQFSWLNGIRVEYFQPRQALRTGLAVMIAVVLQQLVFSYVAQGYWLILAAAFVPQMIVSTNLPYRILFVAIGGAIAVVLSIIGVLVQSHFLLAGVYVAITLFVLVYISGRYHFFRVMSFYLALLTILSVGLPAVMSDALPRGAMLLLGTGLAVLVNLLWVRNPPVLLRYQCVLVLSAMVDFFNAVDRCITDEKYYHNRHLYEKKLTKKRHRVMRLLDELNEQKAQELQKFVYVLHQLFNSIIAFANVRFRYHSAYALLEMRQELDDVCRAVTHTMGVVKAKLKGHTADPDWSALAGALQHLQAITEQALTEQFMLGPVEWEFEDGNDGIEVSFETESTFALHALTMIIECQLGLFQQMFAILDSGSEQEAVL